MKNYKLGLLAMLTVLAVNYAAAVDNNSDVNAAGNKAQSELALRMQKKISVDFRNTPIEDVLRIMADQSGVDIIKSPKVIGNVTATLTNIPLEEALNNILAAQGCGYIASATMVRVLPREDMSEVTERLVSRIYRITYADVKDVSDAVKKFISPRGSMSVNVGTSNIIVTDNESKIKAIDLFIEEVDRITPQISVEARIYDITSQDRLDIGVQWQAGTNTTYAGTSVGDNSTAGKSYPSTTGTFTGSTGYTDSTTGSLRLGWIDAGIDIDMLLSAQKENIDAKLLANPRILVLDNEKANIKIISEIPYQELTETSNGGSIGTIAFKEVGVELEVTPHFARDGMIRLKLKPKFSVQTGSINVGNNTNQYTQPIIATRQAETTLLIEDGKTVVLGGLRKKEVNKQVNKIPFLGDLPVISPAFRFEGEETVISELVVFVTPHIITNLVLTETENKQLHTTEIKSPEPVESKAEAAEKAEAKKLKTEKVKTVKTKTKKIK